MAKFLGVGGCFSMHKAHRPLAHEEREGNKVTGLAQVEMAIFFRSA